MRLPLIVGSTPQEGIKYPSVTLRPGKWMINTTHVSAELALAHSGEVFQNGDFFVLEDVTETRLVCNKAGTDSFITVYVCLCR